MMLTGRLKGVASIRCVDDCLPCESLVTSAVVVISTRDLTMGVGWKGSFAAESADPGFLLNAHHDGWLD